MALSDTLKIVLGMPVVLIMGLSFLARKRPDVRWLEAFDLSGRLTAEQSGRLRRVQNSTAGAKLILLGIIIPMVFFGLKAMFFTGVRASELALVGLVSAACVALGVIALIRSR